MWVALTSQFQARRSQHAGGSDQRQAYQGGRVIVVNRL